MEQKPLKPSAVMRLTGATRKALRPYEAKALITAPYRTHTGHRAYPSRVLDEVRFIRGALDVGFHLSDVKPALETWRKGGSVCPSLSSVYQRRLDEISQRIAELQRQQSRLKAFSCEPSAGTPDDRICPAVSCTTAACC